MQPLVRALNCDSVGIRYGKYCGVGWSGCDAEEPGDDLDACCRDHDHCVDKKGQEVDSSGKSKQSRSEKKSCKAMLKLGMKLDHHLCQSCHSEEKQEREFGAVTHSVWLVSGCSANKTAFPDALCHFFCHMYHSNCQLFISVPCQSALRMALLQLKPRWVPVGCRA